MLSMIILKRYVGILNLSIYLLSEEGRCSCLEAHLPSYSRKLDLYAAIDIPLFPLIVYYFQFNGLEIVETSIGLSCDKLWILVSPYPA